MKKHYSLIKTIFQILIVCLSSFLSTGTFADDHSGKDKKTVLEVVKKRGDALEGDALEGVDKYWKKDKEVVSKAVKRNEYLELLS
jgi:hypothetical protein